MRLSPNKSCHELSLCVCVYLHASSGFFFVSACAAYTGRRYNNTRDIFPSVVEKSHWILRRPMFFVLFLSVSLVGK